MAHFFKKTSRLVVHGRIPRHIGSLTYLTKVQGCLSFDPSLCKFKQIWMLNFMTKYCLKHPQIFDSVFNNFSDSSPCSAKRSGTNAIKHFPTIDYSKEGPGSWIRAQFMLGHFVRSNFTE